MVLLIIGVHGISAQNYHFKRYNLNDGLSTMRIRKAIQDKRGFLWFATCLGLNYYDGHRFRDDIGTMKSEREWLKSADVLGITEDINGILWLCCNKGICSYNPENAKFEIFHNDKYEITALKDIYSDLNGNIWILTIDGTYRLNPNQEQFVKYDESVIPNCSSILISQRGKVWLFSYSEAIYEYDEINDKFTRYNLNSLGIPISSPIVCGTECEDGKLLISTTTSGAFLFDPVTKKAQALFTDVDGEPIFIHTTMRRNKKEFWFGTEKGIWIYDLNKGFIKHLQKSHSEPNSLSDDVIHGLYADKNGGVWVSTFFGGICYLLPENYQFNKYYPYNKAGKVTSNIVREIIEDGDGTIFTSMEDGGICKFTPSSNKYESVSPLIWQNKELADNIQSILIDNDVIWLGTLYEDIYAMSKSGQILKHYDLNNKEIVQLYKSSRGDIFIGTRTGLLHYDRNSDSFFNIPELAGKFVHTIYEDSQQQLWAGTMGQGLFQINHKADSYSGNLQSYDRKNITTLFEDSQGNFWVGTGNNGVYFYDKKKRQILPVNNTLCSDGISVCKIIEDLQKRLWISTSNGLYCYNTNDSTIMKYNFTSLLSSAHFNYNSGHIDKNGIMYLGTIDGLVVFNPMNIDQNIEALEVFFTDISIGKSSFGVSFAVPMRSLDESVWFRYRLVGADEEWNISQEQYAIHYNNLSPGEYTLEVEAAYENGAWSGPCYKYEFEIAPPVWATIWAKILYVIIFVAIAYFVYQQYSILRKKRRQANLLKQRNEQFLELTKEKIRFFTYITHEIRTPLTLIITPLESLLASYSKEKAKEMIPLMYRNAKELLSLINQILDFRKFELGMAKLELTNSDIFSFAHEIAANFKQIANKKKIQYEINIPNETLYIYFDTEKIQRLIYNLLSNAMKFTPEYGKVSIMLEKNQDNVLVVVKDSGIGISEEDQKQIFDLFFQAKKPDTSINTSQAVGSGIGLHLAKEYCEMHNGKITVESAIGTGSTFIASIPTNLHDDNVIPPALQEQADKITVIQNEVETIEQKKTNILLVDDNDELLQYLNIELKEMYNVYLANNGEEAYSLALKNDINIIVSDIMMPVMTGTDLCKKIKENISTSHILIILLTAKTAVEYELIGYKSGADCYISKPFSIDILKDRISYLCKAQQERYNIFKDKFEVDVKELTTSAIDEDLYNKALQFVRENISNSEYNIDRFSQDMCMSRMTLYRKLMSVTGQTPHDFINTIRLKKAAELLLSKKYKVSEVKDLVGFESERNFYRSFKMFYGVTPSNYMQNK